MVERAGRWNRRSLLGVASAGLLLLVAVALIVLPGLSSHSSAPPKDTVRPEISTIDPAALVPQLADLPHGSSVQSNSYVTTNQASQNNHTSLTRLRTDGREIGFDRDFRVPRYGDIEIEVVRFRSHAGMGRAYDYFLTLPAARGLTAVPFNGLGEHAALVSTSQAAFVEFMRGRYYAVITTVPATQGALQYIHTLAHRLDRRILSYGASA